MFSSDGVEEKLPTAGQKGRAYSKPFTLLERNVNRSGKLSAAMSASSGSGKPVTQRGMLSPVTLHQMTVRSVFVRKARVLSPGARKSKSS